MNPLNKSNNNNILEGVHCKVHKDSEIRRFLLKEASVNALYNHLKSLFDIKRGFIVKYRDEEGDLITIGSDEDLLLALEVTKGSLLRLEISGVVSDDKCEDWNLGKKEREEFLGGKGRKFARKEEKRRWKEMKLESKCNKMKVESNGPQTFIPQNAETATQTTDVHELRTKLFAARERVLNQKLALGALKNDGAPEEKIKEAWNNLRSAKQELFMLKRQMREWKVSMRQSKGEANNMQQPQSDWSQVRDLRMNLQVAKAKTLDLKLALGALRKENAPEEKINEAKENVRNAKQELFKIRKEIREKMNNIKQAKCAERMQFKAEHEERNAHQCHRRQMKQCKPDW